MWNFATLALVDHVFEAPSPDEKVYNMQVEAEASTYNSLEIANEKATTQAGAYVGTYGLSSMAFALILTFLFETEKVNRRWVHALSLAIGAAGFFSMKFVTSPEMLHLSYACIGVAWGNILSMPYAMLSSSIKASQIGHNWVSSTYLLLFLKLSLHWVG